MSDVKCDDCANKFREDDVGLCNCCTKNICYDCDIGSVKDGWLCEDCEDFKYTED